jgi:protoporphyrin/coproporphyrin ferrochelatase
VGPQGPRIAASRTPKVRAHYAEIGGKSPILDWTRTQAEGMLASLARSGVAAGQVVAYPCFRYAPPLTESVLEEMRRDGVERAVLFSQYPHYSCTTTGSSLNQVWRAAEAAGLTDAFEWSVIDRWPTHARYVAAVAQRVEEELAALPAEEARETVVVFSAHSVPMLVVNRGDPYTAEVAATAHAVQQALRPRFPATASLLAWQSKVGFLPWMGPSTADVLRGLGRQGHRSVLLVPLGFTSDHIETLYEIDVEYRDLAAQHGITRFRRAKALNDSPLFADALADILLEHLRAPAPVDTPLYALNCPGCTNPLCRSLPNKAYRRLRDRS